MKVGVLALQGGVIEHVKMLQDLKVETVLVKEPKDLESIEGIILPGGESTAIAKLLKISGLETSLKEKIQNGLPCFGTCAGMILLAKEIIGETPHLALMDIVVRRNAYGRQLASFKVEQVIKAISDSVLPLVFIRAPWIEEVKENVQVLFTYDNHIVMARQDNILVSSFHPELDTDHSIHQYFVDMIKEYKK